MSQLIYIRTSYDSGIALPIEALRFIPEAQIIKNDLYASMDNLQVHPEQKLVVQIIDSMEIGAKARKERYIKELTEDLAQNQAALDKLSDAS